MGVVVPDRDSDGITVYKNATAIKGWTYLAFPIEVKTSIVDGCYSKKIDMTDHPVVMKLYNSLDVEITDQGVADTDCVKTVITWSSATDFQIIAGNIYQAMSPMNDVRVWVHGGAVDGGFAYTKEMVGGINLKHICAAIHTDGRSAKYMNLATDGVPIPTNKMQFIIRHDAGVKHEFSFITEMYRA